MLLIKNCDDQNYASGIKSLYVLNKYLFSVDIIVCRRNMVIPIQNGSSLNPMGFAQSNIRKECNIFSRRRLNMTLLNTWIINKNTACPPTSQAKVRKKYHKRYINVFENSILRLAFAFKLLELELIGLVLKGSLLKRIICKTTLDVNHFCHKMY